MTDLEVLLVTAYGKVKVNLSISYIKKSIGDEAVPNQHAKINITNFQMLLGTSQSPTHPSSSPRMTRAGNNPRIQMAY